MTEYIEREALKERFRKRIKWLKKDVHDQYSLGLFHGCEYDADLINEPPAADVAPVKHGRWESVKNPQLPAYSHDKCSLCGWWNTKNALCYDGRKKPGHSLNYCPNCGAKMDLEN